jgi:signal transduction histidine kinase
MSRTRNIASATNVSSAMDGDASSDLDPLGAGGTVEVVVAGEPALSVQNTGQPVPSEVVPALFEPFRRLTAERTHQRDGAGLGPSIVRSTVTAHNGTVSASPGGKGGLRVAVALP